MMTSQLLKQEHYWYFTAFISMWSGVFISARFYPGGFNASYQVATALASCLKNPDGCLWYNLGFVLSLILLWFYISKIKTQIALTHPVAELGWFSLRLGLIAGLLHGLERLLATFSTLSFYLAHESLSLINFFGLYLGLVIVMLFYILQYRRHQVLIVLTHLLFLFVAVMLFWLWQTQRDIGWVNVNWETKGISIWKRFALWQWIAIACLWFGLGVLLKLHDGVKLD